MRVLVDCSFHPSEWPISRELHPVCFRKIGEESPFQIALRVAGEISKEIGVIVDRRIAFMAQEQAEEIGIEVSTKVEFPALVLEPVLSSVPRGIEKLKKLHPPAVVFSRDGKIVAYASESSEVPESGNFLFMDVQTIDLSDFPGVLEGRGAVDLGHYLVVSEVEDVFVVVTDDVTVVTREKSLESVFEDFAEGDRRKVHRTAYRPWGSYTVLEDAPTHKVKRITVLPKKRLSLQMHRKRSERWTVVRGVARVTLGSEILDLKVGESVFIPVETPHRLENPLEDEILEVIEVQIGEYFGEDDIIRLQDDFGRGNEV